VVERRYTQFGSLCGGVFVERLGRERKGSGAEIVTLGGSFISSIHSFGHSFTDAHITFKLQWTKHAIYMHFSCCPS
jgi:hypothetical protein